MHIFSIPAPSFNFLKTPPIAARTPSYFPTPSSLNYFRTDFVCHHSQPQVIRERGRGGVCMKTGANKVLLKLMKACCLKKQTHSWKGRLAIDLCSARAYAPSLGFGHVRLCVCSQGCLFNRAVQRRRGCQHQLLHLWRGLRRGRTRK